MNNVDRHFDELVPMTSSFVEKLNKAIDRTIEEKKKFNINYQMLENILGVIVRNQRFKRISEIDTIVPIKKEEMLSITLNFFKSIDEDFYNEAVKVILGQKDRTKMNIYNVHEVQNFNVRDENGIHKYTPEGCVETYYGNSYVHVPLQERLHKNELELLGKEEGTLEDLYTMVHEITHLFDLNREDTDFKKEEIVEPDIKIDKRNIARELFAESTTIAFEGLLTDYLLSNNLYSKSAIKYIADTRANSSLKDAQMTYAKLVLAREKEKNGKITIEFIEKMMKQNNLTVQDVRRTASGIIDEAHQNRRAMYRNRYAIGGLVAPTIIKAHENDRKNGTKTLKSYLKSVYNGDLEGALNSLGIELTPEGINTLITNQKARDAKINEDMER